MSITAGTEDDQLHSASEKKVLAGFEIRRAHLRWQKTEALGLAGDITMCTMDFLNLTAGEPDNTWVDADFLVVENALDTWWNAIKIYYNATVILDQVRWYREGPSINPPQAAVRVVEKNIIGTGTGDNLPPQIAVSVTERTSVRRRWGRFYLPQPIEGATDAYGRLTNTVVAAIANATAAFYETCALSDIHPVVYSPTVGRAYGVTKVQVDDVLDVIRSRRHRVTMIREVRPA